MGKREQRTIDHAEPSRTLDNRRANLRHATKAQQCANRKTPRNNTSGHAGVSYNVKDKRWMAKLAGVHIGSFTTLEAARTAYRDAAISRHGEFARVA